MAMKYALPARFLNICTNVESFHRRIADLNNSFDFTKRMV